MLLAIETATSICSVALINDGKVVAFREINEGFKHAEKLTVFISEVFEEAGKKLNDVEAIAISSGPGSYTGLRIGVSVAKGLCYALDKPLIGISTLEAMAAGAREVLNQHDENVLYCPMIDARRMEVYCALYDSKFNCIHQPSAIVVDDDLFLDIRNGKRLIYFGDGAEKCQTILKAVNEFIFQPEWFLSAKNMLALAAKKFSLKQFENVALFEPFYLKEFHPGPKKMA